MELAVDLWTGTHETVHQCNTNDINVRHSWIRIRVSRKLHFRLHLQRRHPIAPTTWVDRRSRFRRHDSRRSIGEHSKAWRLLDLQRAKQGHRIYSCSDS